MILLMCFFLVNLLSRRTPRSWTISTCVMMSLPKCSLRSSPCRRRRLCGSSESDDFRFHWIELESLGGTQFVYACDTVLDVCDWIGDACDIWMIWELRVISIQVLVNVMLFDHCEKVLSVNLKFKWPKDWTLGYTTIDDECYWAVCSDLKSLSYVTEVRPVPVEC